MRLPSRLPFRLALPIIFLVISVAMASLGEAQLNRILRNAHPTEPLPNWFAVAKFVDYADNAPAWVAAMNMPNLPLGERLVSNPDVPLPQDWYWRKYLYELDWWYGLFLVVMWFLIGAVLDVRRDEKRFARFQTHRWRNRLLLLLCVPYGALMSLWALYPIDYEGFLRIAVFAWGIALMFVGVCPVSVAGGRAWRFCFGTLFAMVGVFEFWFGSYLCLVAWPTHLLRPWLPSICTILIWGAVLAAIGFYLVLRRPNNELASRRIVVTKSAGTL